jgi:hypothetical protein
LRCFPFQEEEIYAMKSFRLGLASIFLLLLLLLAVSSRAKEDPAYRSYIVFISPPADADTMSRSAHRRYQESFLPSPRPFCSYTTVFYGFAARLTVAELAEMAKLPGFHGALPDGKSQLFLLD